MRVVHVATAFPRHADDPITPWLVELVRRQRASGLDASVLAPAYRGGPVVEATEIPVHRFRYAPAWMETLTHDQTETLRKILEHQGFDFQDKPHAIYSARKGKLNVTVYQKGPKVLVQGKETEDFIRFTLEPEILGEARLGYGEILEPDGHRE